jgi:glutamate racemase
MWVPLVENGEFKHAGADYFVEKYINELFSMSANIDTLLLACTHYPLLLEKIQKYTPSQVSIISQGNIVANSLSNYLLRHQSIDNSLTKGGTQRFYTTDSTIDFDNHALDFFGKPVTSQFLRLS